MEPTVSIVIMVGRARRRGAEALASVLGQDGSERCEVILIDAGPEGVAPLTGSEHPSVRTFRRPQRPPGGCMRAEGVRLARAPVVAFLEEHARALPGFLLGVERVFADETIAAASGEVTNLSRGVGFSDAAHAMSFGRWSPRLTLGWDTDMLNSHNAVYRRSELVELEGLGELMESEILVHWALRRRGKRLRIEPSLRIGHLSEDSARAICRGYYLWHVSFGHTWARAEGWSAARRAAQVVGIPWWVVLRLRGLFTELPGRERRTLLEHLPGVIAAQTAAAIGIAVGCVGRDVTAAQRFTDYELDFERPSATG